MTLCHHRRDCFVCPSHRTEVTPGQDQCPLSPEGYVRCPLLGSLAQRRRQRGVLFTGLEGRNRKEGGVAQISRDLLFCSDS